ncbi:MAG: VWA domain-containing protein [Flavobacteriales bacterium]|nr:VWA domain-containing protein [Flavobacteriales bacterium]
MNFSFDNVEYFSLLLFIPFLIFALKLHNLWKQKKQKSFADKKFREKLFPKNSNYKLKILLYSLFILFMSIALVDILAGTQKIKVNNQGTDIVFAIDVSNSMNCEDIVPSRLEKSKKIIEDILDESSGNRVGIVAFAGEAYTLLPLTRDYSSAKLFLNTLSTNTIELQGTDLGIAIKESCGLFNPNQKYGKTIILISDGEDHEANEDSGIEYANKREVNIICVGIGTQKGETVPLYENGTQIGFLTDAHGDIVVSKLQEKSLKKIAKETSGMYFSDTNSKKIIDFLNSSIKKIQQNQNSRIESTASKHYFQWFLAPALLIIFIISLTNLKNEFNI